MSQEIVYTSAAKGLKPGSRGFCTVISTEGMAANLAERLESHSGYRHAFGPNDDRRHLNPVNWSYTPMRVAGSNIHVLSRIADAGLDYSGRTNKLAHHIALDPSELPAAGPARALMAGILRESWAGDVKVIARRRLPVIAPATSIDCRHWRDATGDAGWAGYVAEALTKSSAPLSVLFPPGTDTLALAVEALDLLPYSQRWGISFSTYFTQLAPGTECRLRFVLSDTAEANQLRNNPHATVIDLAADLPLATGGELVDCARDGRLPAALRAHSESGVSRSSGFSRRVVAPVSGEWESDAASSDGDSQEILVAQLLSDDEVGTYPLQKDMGRPSEPTRPVRTASSMPHDPRAVTPPPLVPPKGKRRTWILWTVCASVLLVGGLAVGLWHQFGMEWKWNGEAENQNLSASSDSSASVDQNFSPSGNGQVDNKPMAREPKEPHPSNRDSTKVSPIKVVVDSRDSNSGKNRESPRPNDPLDTKGSASVGAGHSDSKTETRLHPPAEANPFKDLPRDAGDKRIALLSLPTSSGKKANWLLSVDNLASVRLDLLGRDKIAQGESVVLEELSPASESSRTWRVVRKGSGISGNTEIATFQLKRGSKGGASLEFTWNPQSSAEGDVLSLLALVISADGYKQICRLSAPPASRMRMGFATAKAFNFSRAFDIPSALATVLRQKSSVIRVDAEFSNEFKRTFNEDVRGLAPVVLGETVDIPLLHPRKSTPTTDPVSGIVEFSIRVDSQKPQFTVFLAAFAKLRYYDEEKLKQARLPFETTTELPPLVESRVQLTESVLKQKLAKGPADRLNGLLAGGEDAHQKLLNTKHADFRKREAAPPEERKRLQDEIDKKSQLVADFQRERGRHSSSEFQRQLNGLVGGGPGESLREIIEKSFLTLRISYDVEFANEKYTIVVYEASK